MTKRVLIFDMDGVVVDSMPIHQIAWRQYLESLGIPPDDLITRMHGRRNDDIVLEFLGGSADPKVVDEHGMAKERLYRDLREAYETNAALAFDRQAALGYRLDIPAGTAVRFEPGQSRDVFLIPYGGARLVYGFNGRVMGALPQAPAP